METDLSIPAPRGGLEFDWHHWALVYQRRERKLKKLIAAKGYLIKSDESGMPVELLSKTNEG